VVFFDAHIIIIQCCLYFEERFKELKGVKVAFSTVELHSCYSVIMTQMTKQPLSTEVDWRLFILYQADCQWCSPRAQSLGLEVPRGQTVKSCLCLGLWDPESWSWSWQQSLIYITADYSAFTGCACRSEFSTRLPFSSTKSCTDSRCNTLVHSTMSPTCLALTSTFCWHQPSGSAAAG